MNMQTKLQWASVLILAMGLGLNFCTDYRNVQEKKVLEQEKRALEKEKQSRAVAYKYADYDLYSSQHDFSSDIERIVFGEKCRLWMERNDMDTCPPDPSSEEDDVVVEINLDDFPEGKKLFDYYIQQVIGCGNICDADMLQRDIKERAEGFYKEACVEISIAGKVGDCERIADFFGL